MKGKYYATFEDLVLATEGRVLDVDSLQNWLSTCRSRKAVWLFLWMAEFNRLPGLESLDLSQVNMGSGHMYLVAHDEEGKYSNRFDLTVPAGVCIGNAMMPAWSSRPPTRGQLVRQAECLGKICSAASPEFCLAPKGGTVLSVS